jgi:hypothetical protein
VKKKSWWFALVAVAALLEGCGGSHLPPVPEGEPVAYAKHVEPLVLKRCLDCHTTEEPKANLVLEPGEGFGQMVGRRSGQAPDLDIVEAGDLERSYLWLKLDQRPRTGDGMPRTLFGGKRLPPPELERFRRWIEDGALP